MSCDKGRHMQPWLDIAIPGNRWLVDEGDWDCLRTALRLGLVRLESSKYGDVIAVRLDKLVGDVK